MSDARETVARPLACTLSFLTFEVDDVGAAIRMRTVFPPGAEAMASAFIR